MMAGNPKYYWSMSDMLHPQPNSHDQFVYANNNNYSSLLTDHQTQDFPVRSWSQLLLGGGGEEEEDQERYNGHRQVLNLNASRINDHDQAARSWPPVSSSQTSCLTSLSSNNFFNFAGENSSECNSTNTGGVSKRARVSSQPPLKVRKEKLGDRITALHQLVSPFGKTDTASVLSEAIGYIRFLQAQIQALSAPYMRNSSSPNSDSENRGTNDLSSRGLCLVPISCTDSVGDDNGADYWASAALGGGF